MTSPLPNLVSETTRLGEIGSPPLPKNLPRIARWALLIPWLLGGSPLRATGLESVLGADLAAGIEPLALGFDEAGSPHLLEAKRDPDGRGPGRVRAWPAGGGGEARVIAEELPLEAGRTALLAWRGRCYLAATPAIRIIDPKDGDKGGSMVRPLDPGFQVPSSADGEGFGGLTMAPDGRIYGSFSGGSASGVADAVDNPGFVFRFEPDGSGFEVVHRGLIRPSAPVFDDHGRARLIARGGGDGKEPQLLRLLDGGFGASGETFSGPSNALPEAAATGKFGAGGARVWSIGGARGDSPPQLRTWQIGANRKGVTDGESVSLPEGARIVDLSSDWNGRPHLLVWNDRGQSAASTIEVLALATAADAADGGDRLALVAKHLDDPLRDDGSSLIDLFRDPQRRIRWQAIWALSRRSDAPALSQHAFGQGDAGSTEGAIGTLAVIARRGAGVVVPGDDPEFSSLPQEPFARKAAEALAGLLSNTDPAIRVQALRALASARRPAGLIPFPKLLADPDPLVREETLLAAARLRWRAIATSLTTAKANGAPAPSINRLADVLERVHQPAQLQAYARHRDQHLRLAAVEALRRSAHPALAGFVPDAEPGVAAAAVLAIDEKQVEAAFPAVAGRIADGPPQDWPAAAREAALRCAEAVER